MRIVVDVVSVTVMLLFVTVLTAAAFQKECRDASTAVYTSTHLSISLCPFIHLSTYPSINQSIYLSTHLSIYLCLCMRIDEYILLLCIYVYTSVYQHFYARLYAFHELSVPEGTGGLPESPRSPRACLAPRTLARAARQRGGPGPGVYGIMLLMVEILQDFFT